MTCEMCALSVGQRVILPTVSMCDECGDIHQLTYRPAIYKGLIDNGTIHTFDVSESGARCPKCGGLREELLSPCQDGVEVSESVDVTHGSERPED